MRLHTDNAEQFLQALAQTLGKDPASLEGWRCLHVVHRMNDDTEWYGAILTHYAHTKHELDCDVVHCADDDIFILSRQLSVDALYMLADPFIIAASAPDGIAGDVALYDLHHDWRMVQAVLLHKVGAPPEAIPDPDSYNFGEMASVQEVLMEAKRQRSARMPLHVMVVDDDALTRRIVGNAFKDRYAVINATNAHEAVTSYLEHAPDIVFLDIGLPDANGFDVLEQIIAADADAYIVMFSSSRELSSITRAMTRGACGFVSKPFKPDTMRNYIHCSAAHHQKHTA